MAKKKSKLSPDLIEHLEKSQAQLRAIENHKHAAGLLFETARGLGYELDSGVRNGDLIVFTCRKSGCHAFLQDDGKVFGTAVTHGCEDTVNKDIHFEHGHQISEETLAKASKHWKHGK